MMPRRRQPASLYSSAKAVLKDSISSRVVVMLYSRNSLTRELEKLYTMVSSLPLGLSNDIALRALRSADVHGEMLILPPVLLSLLARVLIHDSTTAFPIAPFGSYQVRQAVLHRLCDLCYLRVYHNPQYFHENFNVFSTLQRLQSLPNLRQVYLKDWCSDEIAHLLGKSCPALTLLDAEYSQSLTDSSVPSLIQCRRLNVLLIRSTSISDDGYQTLLEKLPLLRNIGSCDRLCSILSRAEKNQKSLSLREYESCEVPDATVFRLCPQLASVRLYGTKERATQGPIHKLSHQVTHLKLQATSDYLNQLLTSSILHLDLHEYHEPITEANVTTIATVCTQLRVLRLKQLSSQCRLVQLAPARHKEPFPFSHLEELEIPDSALALDIANVAPRIRLITVQRARSSPFSLESVPAYWTDDALRTLTQRSSLQCLESFYLKTRCSFFIETLFDFILACPELRTLGALQDWGRRWETNGLDINAFLEKHSLDVEIIP